METLQHRERVLRGALGGAGGRLHSVVEVAEVRRNTDSVIAGARLGRTAHIVERGEVVARLVPPTARIVDQDELLAAMTTAMLRSEAEMIGRGGSGGLAGVGVDTGRLFVWAWRTDVRLFDNVLGRFGEMLGAQGRPYSRAEVFGVVRGAMGDAGLDAGEIAEVEHHATKD